jgi:hypothetical protein
LLVSASTNPGGVPQQFIDQREADLRRQQEIAEELKRRQALVDARLGGGPRSSRWDRDKDADRGADRGGGGGAGGQSVVSGGRQLGATQPISADGGGAESGDGGRGEGGDRQRCVVLRPRTPYAL